VSNLRCYTAPSLAWNGRGNTREIAVIITNHWLRYEPWISRLRSMIGNGCTAASTSSREFIPNAYVGIVTVSLCVPGQLTVHAKLNYVQTKEINTKNSCCFIRKLVM